jgi:hypothetical protein
MPAIVESTRPAQSEPAIEAVPPDPLRNCLRSDDLAAALKVTVPTIRQWAKTGLIPPGRRIGKFLIWRADEIAAFLASRN